MTQKELLERWEEMRHWTNAICYMIQDPGRYDLYQDAFGDIKSNLDELHLDTTVYIRDHAKGN